MKIKTMTTTGSSTDILKTVQSLTGWKNSASDGSSLVINGDLSIGITSGGSGWTHIMLKNFQGAKYLIGVQNIKFIDRFLSDDGAVTAMSYRENSNDPYRFCTIIFQNENGTYGGVNTMWDGTTDNGIVYEDSSFLFKNTAFASYDSSYQPSFVKHYNPVTGVFAKSLYRLDTGASDTMPPMSKFTAGGKKFICFSPTQAEKFACEVGSFEIEQE